MTRTIKINLSENGSKGESKRSDIQAKIKDNELYVTGVPDGHALEYVARDAETKSKLFVLHRPEKNWNYNSFRLHIGTEAQLAEAQVQNVKRYLDGGTTIINYTLANEQGRLHFPTSLNEEARPTDTYQGKTTELEKLV